MTRAAIAATAVAALLTAAGCGGTKSGGPATTTRTSADQQLFVLKCGACHKLEAAGSTGTFGGDLDKLKPSRAAVLAAIVGGPGTMPPNIVQGAEAQKIAEYVARVAGR